MRARHFHSLFNSEYNGKKRRRERYKEKGKREENGIWRAKGGEDRAELSQGKLLTLSVIDDRLAALVEVVVELTRCLTSWGLEE